MNENFTYSPEINAEVLSLINTLIAEGLLSAQEVESVAEPRFTIKESKEGIEGQSLLELFNSLVRHRVEMNEGKKKDILILCQLIFARINGFHTPADFETMLTNSRFIQVLEYVGSNIILSNQTDQISIIADSEKVTVSDKVYPRFLLGLFKPWSEWPHGI